MFIESTSFLGNMNSNWFFGIEPNAFGAIGAMFNFLTAYIVSKNYPSPPLKVVEMIKKIRKP
jgi:cation/acetate symporter